MKKLTLLPILLLFFSCTDEIVEPDLCTTVITSTETCTRCFETASQKEAWFRKCMPTQLFTCSQLFYCE